MYRRGRPYGSVRLTPELRVPLQPELERVLREPGQFLPGPLAQWTAACWRCRSNPEVAVVAQLQLALPERALPEPVPPLVPVLELLVREQQVREQQVLEPGLALRLLELQRSP